MLNLLNWLGLTGWFGNKVIDRIFPDPEEAFERHRQWIREHPEEHRRWMEAHPEKTE